MSDNYYLQNIKLYDHMEIVYLDMKLNREGILSHLSEWDVDISDPDSIYATQKGVTMVFKKDTKLCANELRTVLQRLYTGKISQRK